MRAVHASCGCRLQPPHAPVLLAPQCLAQHKTRPAVSATAKLSFNSHHVRSRQVVRFKSPAAEVEEVLGYQHLPYDCTELLDLHGKDSFLLCDISKAHENLLSMPLIEGYSPEVVEGRVEVLDLVKEQALYHEGRVQQEKGFDLPMELLPSALALLAQLNQNESVYELAVHLLENWDMPTTVKRDLTLSLVVAHCNMARDLLAHEKIAEGCSVLEDGLSYLHSAGDPPLAPSLAADIQQGLDSMVVQRIMDHFNSDNAAIPSERQKAVLLLRGLLTSDNAEQGGGGLRGLLGATGANEAVAAGVTPDYIRQVVDCLSCSELVAIANWDQVARKARSTSWLYPGLLQLVATAHVATAISEQRVAAARTALALLKAVPASCEVLLLKGVTHMLLNSPKAAAEAIKAAASAPLDGHINWKVAAPPAPAGGDEGAEGLTAIQLPAGPDAYDFVVAYSQPDDEPALMTGLFVYADAFLSQVVLAGFPETSQLQGTQPLHAYFESPDIQEQLAQDKEHSTRLSENLTAVKDAVMSVQPLMQQFAATASSTLSSLQATTASYSRGPMAARLASDVSERQDQLETGSAGAEYDAASGARQNPIDAIADRVHSATAQAAEAADRLSGGKLGVLTQGLNERLGGRLPSAAAGAAGAAALAAVVLVGSLGRRASPAVPPQHQPMTAVQSDQGEAAAAASSVRPLDKGAAGKLLKRFQAAKSAALGSNFDATQLGDVCVGPALARFQGMSQDWASKGWFRTANVWKCEVQRVEPLVPSGLRVLVTARVGEKAETWGIDGQKGSSWSNEYDVDYDVVLCRDLQWRIQNVTVRGQEPGMPGWLGAGLFSIFGGTK